ncbi:hypothetical protein O7606_20355 [Micromonospora sp. WMMD882]|uniref:hypothetical protein n=1 Tax=Micromonospora sp. WMMD882 TaxID=3015151 RepID=UPI00248B536A|nr:hypothetical protein [Micromonospora sp. WMMD882]WBB78557.1 hypothetical protein O7606_20355 [Micromonospora sp. WMMD882]
MSDRTMAAELSSVQTAEGLAGCIRDLLSRHGNLSLRELESWGIAYNRPMPRTSLSEARSGVRPPSRQLLLNLLAACKVRDDQEVSAWLDALDRINRSKSVQARQRSLGDLTQPVSANRFFAEQDDLIEISHLIQQAQDEVWLWGTTLSMHIPYLDYYIGQALARDVRVKVLLINPGGAAMSMLAFRAGPAWGRQRLRERLAINLGLLEQRREERDGLEIRLVDYLPPYTLYAYDPGLDDGSMELRLGSVGGKHDLRPTFRLIRKRDAEWFDYFYEQFTSVWNAADQYRNGEAPDTHAG